MRWTVIAVCSHVVDAIHSVEVVLNFVKESAVIHRNSSNCFIVQYAVAEV